MKKELLKLKNVQMSERKISRIMKLLGFSSKYGRPRGKNVYTSKNTEKYIHEYIFPKVENKEEKEIWSMDFTEEKINGKKIYTCGIISVNSKILVGYIQGKKCTSEMAIKCVTSAISKFGKPYMIMTDRGTQFTSKMFYDMISGNNILHCMSRPHTPVDNRFIETFWKSMKVEIGKLSLLNEYTYAMVVDYYINYYNNVRPHSSLGYKAPLALKFSA